MSKSLERLIIGVNVLITLLVSAFMLRSGGPVQGAWDDWQHQRAMRRTLSTSWEQMVATGGRLDNMAGSPKLVEFSDYQCPFCREAHLRMDTLLANHPDLGVVYVHFPLPIHPAAPGAARASICAQEQGRFRAMDKELFETTAWQTDTNWDREAKAAGIADMARFNQCLRSPATASRLARDVALGHALGVSGTPTFYSKTGTVSGMPPDPDMARFAGVR
jgi:protein-disulfide isomerase